MAIFRCVSPNFWSDPKVDDDFTPEDKYFYLYLLTNPHTTLSGCYELGKRQASRELGYNEETVDRLIHRMETVHNVIRYDKATKEILLLNWHKYNWSKSPKCLKGVEYSLQNIKSDAFRKYCADTLCRWRAASVSKNFVRRTEIGEIPDFCKDHSSGVYSHAGNRENWWIELIYDFLNRIFDFVDLGGKFLNEFNGMLQFQRFSRHDRANRSSGCLSNLDGFLFSVASFGRCCKKVCQLGKMDF